MPGEPSVVLLERQDISSDGLIYRRSYSNKKTKTKKPNNTLQVYLLVIGVRFFFFWNKLQAVLMRWFQLPLTVSSISRQRVLLLNEKEIPRDFYWSLFCIFPGNFIEPGCVANIRRDKKFKEQTLPLSLIHCLCQVTARINHSLFSPLELAT